MDMQLSQLYPNMPVFEVTTQVRLTITLSIQDRSFCVVVNAWITYHGRTMKLAGYSILDIGHSNVQCPISNIRLTSRSSHGTEVHQPNDVLYWLFTCMAKRCGKSFDIASLTTSLSLQYLRDISQWYCNFPLSQGCLMLTSLLFTCKTTGLGNMELYDKNASKVHKAQIFVLHGIFMASETLLCDPWNGVTERLKACTS